VNHKWEEWSGTTVHCELCGVTRQSLDADGQYVANRFARAFEYRRGARHIKATRVMPKCVDEPRERA
jgi:hypothetical protein